jgi:hypothetical protein
MTWTYFLKKKLEVFLIFKEFQVMVENSSKRKNQGFSQQ